jgi:hypothetical protein
MVVEILGLKSRIVKLILNLSDDLLPRSTLICSS